MHEKKNDCMIYIWNRSMCIFFYSMVNLSGARACIFLIITNINHMTKDLCSLKCNWAHSIFLHIENTLHCKSGVIECKGRKEKKIASSNTHTHRWFEVISLKDYVWLNEVVVRKFHVCIENDVVRKKWNIWYSQSLDIWRWYVWILTKIQMKCTSAYM